MAMNPSLILRSLGVQVSDEQIAQATETIKTLPKTVENIAARFDEMERRNVQAFQMIEDILRMVRALRNGRDTSERFDAEHRAQLEIDYAGLDISDFERMALGATFNDGNDHRNGNGDGDGNASAVTG